MNKRFVSALAALALGTAAIAAAPPAAASGSSGASYVAFGDSEAAGTGNFLYVDRSCLRSRLSYPLLLGGTSYACSGATTGDVLDQIAAAVDASTLGRSTKLVTVTAGVNDLGWVQILETCYTQGDTACASAVQGAVSKLPLVASGIGQIVDVISDAAPNAKILVTGYPHLFGNVATSCTIGWYAGGQVSVSAVQASLTNGGVDALDTAIAQGVAGSGVAGASYVDVMPTFAGHSLCDTGSSWISGVIGLPVLSDRSLHINARGQIALADLIWRSRWAASYSESASAA